MDPTEWRLPGVMGCTGNNCGSDPRIWPLYYARQGDGFTRLCSSCVLISCRSLYCCGCFFLLGTASSSLIDDPLVAPHEATVTCLACHESVAHLSCIDYSTVGVFICPVCTAAAAGMPFSYMPSFNVPLDMRGARVFLLSARIAQTLLNKEAVHARAKGEKLVVEAAKERKEAYHALSVALGVDTKTPSTNKHVPLRRNLGQEPLIDMAELDLGNEPLIDMAEVDMAELELGKEPLNDMAELDLGKEPQIDMAELDLGKEPQIDMAKLDLGKEPLIDMAKLDLGKEPLIDMAKMDLNEPKINMSKLDLNEPAPPPSPIVCMEAMASSEPSQPSMIKSTFEMDGLRREPAASSSQAPPPSMPTFTSGMWGARRESTMVSTQPPLSTLAAVTLSMEGFCREFLAASKETPPRPQTLQLFSKDKGKERE